jgi:hypothetical protein
MNRRPANRSLNIGHGDIGNPRSRDQTPGAATRPHGSRARRQAEGLPGRTGALGALPAMLRTSGAPVLLLGRSLGDSP